jgi:hypothetical protein
MTCQEEQTRDHQQQQYCGRNCGEQDTPGEQSLFAVVMP